MRLTLVVVMACAFACNNKQDRAPAPSKEAPKPVETKPPAHDPWAGAPAEVKTQLGAKTGASLSKIEVQAPAALTAKVDPATIDQPVAPQAEVKSFTGDAPAGFTVTYSRSKNPAHEEYREALSHERVFDKVAESLNSTVRIPHNVTIQTVDCNTVNAFYDPSTNRIIVCYELLDYFIETFKPHFKTDAELGSSVIGATIFSFYHETGHGLIHQLDLAAVGREEDSVDQLATLILISQGESGVQMALSGAYWFQLQTQSDHKTAFWDEHGFDGQRFYNILCLIYGSNPDKYKAFVANGDLPEARAQRCPEEYRKINKAWQHLLEPYLTNGAATNVSYKPSVPVVEAPRTTKTDPWGDGEAGNSTPTTEPWGGDDEPNKPAPATTCEQVADHAAELIKAEAEERAKSMSPDEVDELERRLEAQLPAAMQKLLAQCAKEAWSEASRKCVLDATTLAAATTCK